MEEIPERPFTPFENKQTEDEIIKDLHLLDQMNKYPSLKKYVQDHVKKQENNKIVSHRDYHIIGLFYYDKSAFGALKDFHEISDFVKSNICKEFKKVIQDTILYYKSINKSYFIKTFCDQDVSFEVFGDFDMINEVLPNGNVIYNQYSSGNSQHTYTTKLSKELSKDWLIENQGIIGNIAELNLLADSPFFNIFEYKIPN